MTHPSPKERTEDGMGDPSPLKSILPTKHALNVVTKMGTLAAFRPPPMKVVLVSTPQVSQLLNLQVGHFLLQL